MTVAGAGPGGRRPANDSRTRKAASPTRALALRILDEIERGGGSLAERLADPEAEALAERERAFLHELVLGTLRHRGAIDYALRPLLDRPLARLDPAVRNVLRLGAHQILNLRVPDRAAVAESVELVRSSQRKATGFVNAVLRRLTREGTPRFPSETSDPRGWLTSQGSLPPWLADRWLARLGPERTVLRARAHLKAPPNAFRYNPRFVDAAARAASAGVEAAPGALPGAFRATSGRLQSLQQEGVVYAQDEGSQLIARLASGPGRRLDACAAPGGKSLLMADLAGAGGLVVAAESSPRRLAAMRSSSLRWQAPNLHLVAADGLRPPFRGPFTAVLVDAPCSGLGTIGRHPDLRWRAHEGDLLRHGRAQRQLLDSLSSLVAKGGLLVYAVCSTEPEESEEVVVPFLASHLDFEPAPLPSWAEPFADGPFVRIHPEMHGTDGFFGAPLRRL